ncbi:MAG TPA: hypothetical protein VGY54_01345 [Polyangiaceae bacterium]|jgi:DNA-directed RNA polymerase specialized sigma24 family protein|nr:hypothetical protein [Polyangiaceae bacterium]
MLACVVWDQDDPYIKRILEEFGKGMVRHRLIKFGRWLLQSNNETDGEDLLQEALILVCSRKKPWDGAGSFFGHMAWVMKFLNIDERRLARATLEVVDSNLARDDVIVDPAPMPDEAVNDRRELDRLRRLGQLLIDRLEPDDEDARQVLFHGAQGVEGRADLADKIGCSEQAVQNAQRRIARLASEILDEERAAEAKRMSELRETAKLGKKATIGTSEGTS